jgi:hypothetical protein
VAQTYGIGGENNMGFLDKLQDIGIGNRGPYGGRESGAQYFGRQVDASVTNTKERGLTQALAEAAKGGKISFDKQIELSEMWGIPLQEVMARSKPVNATHENTRLENFGKTAYQLVQSFKKENPGKTITQKDVQGMMEQAGAQSAEDAAYFQAAVQKIQGQAKFMKVGKNERVFPVNLRGEPGEKAIIEPEPETPDETPAEKLQRDKDLATYKQGLKPKVPDAPDEKRIVVRPGNAVIDKDGNVIFSLPKDSPTKESKNHILKPGDILVDGAGKEIAKHPDSKPVKETGTNWILPDTLESVISYNDRTYVDKDGNVQNLPSGANKAKFDLSGKDMLTIQDKNKAMGVVTDKVKPKNMEGAGRKGTGPYASFAAAFDAVAGGLGLDALFGKDGFYKDITDARQDLKLIKRMAQEALRKGSRPGVWLEKQIIELLPNPNTIFTNSATEARKIPKLIETLKVEKQLNSEAIGRSSNPDDINRLKAANEEIIKLMAHLGVDETDKPPLSPEAAKWLKDKGY